MPRFYFDYTDGENTARDEVGTMLRNLAAAKDEAVSAAGEWMKDHASAEGLTLTLSVRDKGPTPLFVVTACIKVTAG